MIPNEMEAEILDMVVLWRKAHSNGREILQNSKEKYQAPSGYNTATGINVANKRV